ncbi:MAG TPA: RecX family transcriptional regulator [Gemmatimonadaceae bacterium]|nr:RecX family transcriptional regulator [Gemmatimonadaceae bacterium]
MKKVQRIRMREPEGLPLVPDADAPAGLVTAITPSHRKEGRFDVCVDGEAVAVLSLETIERLALHVGSGFTAAVRTQVENEAQALRVYDRALDLLAFRARAARELRLALIRKGEPAPYVDRAIARLESLGLLDDAAFARQFSRSRIAGPGFSRRRLQSELARRGVAREVADAAIADAIGDDGTDMDDTLERIAMRKLHTLRSVSAPVRRRRLYAFLARRGYDADAIRRVLERIDADGAGAELDAASGDAAATDDGDAVDPG